MGTLPALLLFAAFLLLAIVLPQTQSERDAIENRRLRAQRRSGNFDATPRKRKY